MGTLDAVMDVLLRDKTFYLKVVSWRQFLHGANRSESRECLDDHRIELTCRLLQSLLQEDTIVGDEPEEKLHSLEFVIEIRSAQKVFAEVEAKNPASEEMKNGSGLLVYYPPIEPRHLAGLPSSEIEKSKTGSVNGWVFFGNDTVREISRLLTLQPELQVHLSATVNAAAKATPKSLIYEPQEHRPTRYRWAKNNALEIKEAHVVVAKAPVTEPELPAEPTESPMLLVMSQKITNSIDSLNMNVRRLGFFIVLVLGLILVELWQHR